MVRNYKTKPNGRQNPAIPRERKEEALRRVKEGKCSIRQIGRDLNIAESTIRKLIKKEAERSLEGNSEIVEALCSR